jgi:hypothetical protein
MKKNEINDRYHRVFDDDRKVFKLLNWNMKSVLAASKDNYYTERFSDLEFTFSQVGNFNFRIVMMVY